MRNQILFRGLCLLLLNFSATTLLKGQDSSAAEKLAKSQDRRHEGEVGDHYAVPENPRIVVDQNPGWRFKFSPAGMPESFGCDDSSWGKIDLPHTWNAIDGASVNYALGTGWYRKHLSFPKNTAGMRLYLHFEGASIETSLYIDGKQIDLNPVTPTMDSHLGGFQAFNFDVTDALSAPVPQGQDGHLAAVAVSNAANPNVPPCGWGDYSKEGGIYRNVSLIAVSPTHAAMSIKLGHLGVGGTDIPSLISSPAVHFTHSPVVIGAASAQLNIKTTLDNFTDASNVKVISYLVDAQGVVRAKASSQQSLSAMETGVTVEQTTLVQNPHLWDARIDPYLYSLYVEVRNLTDDRLLDLEMHAVGIRSIQINSNPDPSSSDPLLRAPLELNGHAYRVVGADMHQDSGALNADGNPVGWARSEKQIHDDIDALLEMGGTGIRTSHYQDNPEFYQYCDKVGLLVYTESPINGKVSPGDAFLSNAQDQFNELAHQTMDDPCVFAWGFGNETGTSAALVRTFKAFGEIAHTLDPARKSGFATYGGSASTSSNADGVPNIKGTHLYDYWYGGTSHPDKTHDAYLQQPLGVTEYGGGASAYQYADTFKLPVSAQPGGVKIHFHPANQQARIEELQYTDLSSLPYIWGQFTWQMFDNASSGKNEGDQGGVNDKGLVNRSRVRKDAFYFYKAALNDPSRSWANEPVLHVSDRFWTCRNSPAATVTVFSNVGDPTLILNGVSLGEMPAFSAKAGTASTAPGTTRVISATYTMDVTLVEGANSLQATTTAANGKKYTDSASWSYYNHLEGTPVAQVAFLGKDESPPLGFLPDRGDDYQPQSTSTYGWRNMAGTQTSLKNGPSTDAIPNGFVLNYDPISKTGSTWEFKLTDGIYDVEIGTGRDDKGETVNMFSLEGKTAAIASDRRPQQTFFARVSISDGNLTLNPALGAVRPRIAYIRINRVKGL